MRKIIIMLMITLMLTGCQDEFTEVEPLTPGPTETQTVTTTSSPTIEPTIFATTPKPTETPAKIKVYITDTGSKYHRKWCKYLYNSSNVINLESAKLKGYEPCSVCDPPTN